MAQKKCQDLDLKDAFLFTAALSDAETCRMRLEVILEEKIGWVQVHGEHILLSDPAFLQEIYQKYQISSNIQ